MLRKLLLSFVILFAANTMFSQTSSPADTVITIRVKGVTCKNDLVTLSDNIKDLKGVSECKPVKSGPVSEFQVSFNRALVNTKEIFSAIENTPGCSDPKDRPYKVKNN